jgi:hypothetical protein
MNLEKITKENEIVELLVEKIVEISVSVNSFYPEKEIDEQIKEYNQLRSFAEKKFEIDTTPYSNILRKTSSPVTYSLIDYLK